MTTETQDARIRFVPRQQTDKRWRVYDRFNGSYPFQRPVLGRVAQDVATEAEAQAEADRLNALHFEGKVPVMKRERQEYKSYD